MKKLHEHSPLIVYETQIEGYKDKLNELYHKHSFDNNSEFITGEANGKVLVHKDPEFTSFFTQVKKKVEDYLDIFLIDKDLFDINFIKSWYTICRDGYSVPMHYHSCSHISYVYYLDVMENDPLVFKSENPNEWFGDVFKFTKGKNQYNSWGYALQPKDETLLIFPGNLKHFTDSRRDYTRKSIAGDIILTLKEQHLNFDSGILPSVYWSQF